MKTGMMILATAVASVLLTVALTNALVVKPLQAEVQTLTMEQRVVVLETLAKGANLPKLPQHLAASLQAMQGMNAQLQALKKQVSEIDAIVRPPEEEDDKKKKR